MLTCKQVTRKISEEQDRQLSLGEKMGLKFHLMMCKGCRNYASQLEVISMACRHISGRDENK